MFNKLKHPLVWIDMEMTGLRLGHDKTIEIAVLLSNGGLQSSSPLHEIYLR
jgi:oligoribonuclease (3'-5' exoribonuclease)